MVLKPDPGNPQELYLGSLRALGIDTQRHDVRFVEDNWENPALGAWGLGWEVWMDGELMQHRSVSEDWRLDATFGGLRHQMRMQARRSHSSRISSKLAATPWRSPA